MEHENDDRALAPSPRKPGVPARPLADRFWPKVDRSGGPESCWVWTGAHTRFGYGVVWDTDQRLIGAHRASWRLVHGELPSDRDVLHRCDSPPCVNPAHLFLGTPSDNNRDCVAKGRHARAGARGEANPNAKLTDDLVRAVRREWAAYLAAGGTRYRWVGTQARRLGVRRDVLTDILSGKTWKHAQ